MGHLQFFLQILLLKDNLNISTRNAVLIVLQYIFMIFNEETIFHTHIFHSLIDPTKSSKNTQQKPTEVNSMLKITVHTALRKQPLETQNIAC